MSSELVVWLDQQKAPAVEKSDWTEQANDFVPAPEPEATKPYV